MRTWRQIMFFIILVACVALPVASSELVELHDNFQNETSWIEYGNGVNVTIWVENKDTNEKKTTIIYPILAFFNSSSAFEESFEDIVNGYNDMAVDNGESFIEITQYAMIGRVPWMGTWTPDDDYSYHKVDSSH